MTIGSHLLPTEVLRTCTDGMLWCFADWAYKVTNGMFWTFMLMGFCVALFMATAKMGSTRAFGYATFVGMIGATWFAIMQLMPWWITTVFIISGLIGMAMMVLNEK